MPKSISKYAQFRLLVTVAGLMAICIQFCFSSSQQLAQPEIPVPVATPNGATAFVGSLEVGFEPQVLGNIYYTLNGQSPTSKNRILYEKGTTFTVDKSLTLNAVTYLAGNPGNISTTTFTRAVLPSPIAKYGGSTNFNPTLICTLIVDKAGIAPFIRYTLDGSIPKATSPIYSGPIIIKNTATIKAYAGDVGYDDSPPMAATFNLVDPVQTPTATYLNKTFATKSISVKLSCGTPGALIHYSTDPKANLDSADIFQSDSISIVGSIPGETIILRAKAMKTNYPSSNILTVNFTYLPPVASPIPSKPPDFFYDTLRLGFTNSTLGATTHYTLNGLPPTINSPDTLLPIFLDNTTLVTAASFKAPLPQSQEFSGTYTLRLTPPLADKPSRQFMDNLEVKLHSACPGAKIFYTLDGELPTTASPQYLEVPIGISKDSTKLTAIAVKGGVQSPPSMNLYFKTVVIGLLPEPTIDPVSREFKDQQVITISNSIPSAEIRYTLDGSTPTQASPLYTVPFPIDSTLSLKAKAFPTQGNFQASTVKEEKYTLLPSPPYAVTESSGPFQNQVSFILKTDTRGGAISYILGEQILDLALAIPYKTGDRITLTTTTKIQAVTLLGTGAQALKSSPLSQVFEIYFSVPTDTLLAGSARQLGDGFKFTNSAPTPIIAKVKSSDNLSIIGFKEAGLILEIQSIPVGQAINVVFTKLATQTHSLYRIVNGSVEYLSSNPRIDITTTGTYFVGIDTLPPVITLLSQTAKSGDSTIIRLLVKDNVSAPLCEIASQGLPGGKFIGSPDAEGIISTGLKNLGNEPKALWFRAKATDKYNATPLPKDPLGKVCLAQSWESVTVPAVFTIGREKAPWDMAGLPVGESARITWGQLRAANPDANLLGAVLADSVNYRFTTDEELIRPGVSFWLGSTKSLSNLVLRQFKSRESESNGAYKLTLHPGWNQVSNPSLEKLYWPVSRKDANFGSSLVKALYEWSPKILNYATTDSLEPWKGYFVYLYGSKDTTLSLYAEPKKSLPAKTSAFPQEMREPVARELRLTLGFGKSIPLMLGASDLAKDAFSVEDEVALPNFQSGFSIWSQRGNRHLVSDVLKLDAQSVLQWQLIVTDSAVLNDPGSAVNLLQVLDGKLPNGYQAWAVSKTRGIKFLLEEGASLPLDGPTRDTLLIFAGPLGKLASVPELAKAVLKVEKFAFRLESDQAGQYFVNLSLPWNSTVDLSLFSISGQLVTHFVYRKLGSGIHHLKLRTSHSNELGILRINITGNEMKKQYFQKIVR